MADPLPGSGGANGNGDARGGAAISGEAKLTINASNDAEIVLVDVG